MHDRLLKILLDIADVRLVASYTDDGLGLPADSIQVFLPDLHLLSAERRELYRYGTNYADTLLIDLTEALLRLRRDARADGRRVNVFQIGDYLDLWRQTLLPRLDPSVPDQIKDSHQKLTELLEDPALNTGFLLGNHDFDLGEFVGYNAWERRFFLPGNDPRVIVMHGDYFDWIERALPEEIRDVAVYLFGQSAQAGSALIGKMRDLTYRTNHADYSGFIQLQQPAVLGSLGSHEENDLSGDFNVQNLDSGEGAKFLEKACAECAQVNRDSGSKLRMVVIGHTHHARIAATRMADGTPFALVDIGAWIENCVETEGSAPIPNAQIAALAENQARIYQLSPK